MPRDVIRSLTSQPSRASLLAVNPWETEEGRRSVNDWRKNNPGEDFYPELSNPTDTKLARYGAGATLAGHAGEVMEASNLARSSGAAAGLSKVLGPVSQVAGVSMSYAQRNDALSRIPRAQKTETLGEAMSDFYTHGLPDEEKDMLKKDYYERGMYDPSGMGGLFTLLASGRPKAAVESVPAVLPWGERISDYLLSKLPESWGGKSESETDEDYYNRTGRYLGHGTDQLGADAYGSENLIRMTDEQVYRKMRPPTSSFEGTHFPL